MPLPILPPPPPFPGSPPAVNQWLANDLFPYLQAMEPHLVRLEEIALFDVGHNARLAGIIDVFLALRSEGQGSNRNLHDDIRDIKSLLTAWRLEFAFYLANRPEPFP